MENNEVEKFFEGLPSQDKPFENLVDDKVPEKEEEKPEEGEHKNRRERRLAKQLEDERKGGIALNERIKELSEEVGKLKPALSANVDERLTQIFGNDDNGKLITKHFSEILAEVKGEAKKEALREIEEYQSLQREEESKESEFIENQFDHLEEAYGVDLTSDTSKAKKMRNDFIDLISELSPKDKNGEIIEYADFDRTFKIFQNMQPKVESRNKELAARTMQQSKSSDSSSQNLDAHEQWLIENGIKTRI